MANRGRSLEALYNRKREQENQRNNQKKALTNYYNHWSEVNNRFNNWTKEEHNEKANTQLQKVKEEKTREETLRERRQHLNSLISNEDSHLGAAQRELKNRKPRRIPADDETLIQEALQEERRKLYANKNVAVAEQERRQEERNERQKKRDEKINELRATQDMHLEELRESQCEVNLLKEEERKLREAIDDIEKEATILNKKCSIVLQPSVLDGTHTLKKVKPFLLKRCNIFRQNINESIDFVQHIRDCTNKSQELDELLEKYQKQKEIERLSYEQIEGMFESEAKFNLKSFEEEWQLQLLDRYEEMSDLLKNEIIQRKADLKENLEKQTDVFNARAEQISSMEDTNKQLEELFSQQRNSPRLNANSALFERTTDEIISNEKKRLQNSLKNIIITDTFDSTQAASVLTHDGDFPAPRYRPSKKLRPIASLVNASSSKATVSNSMLTLNLDGKESSLRSMPAMQNLHLDATNDSDKVSLRSQHSQRSSCSMPRVNNSVRDYNLDANDNSDKMSLKTDVLKRPTFGRKRITWD